VSYLGRDPDGIVTSEQEDRLAMPVFEHSGLSIEVDDDGFMAQPDRWTPIIAEALAAGDGIDTLTEDHWKIMNYIRGYYAEFGVAPMVRKLCKETGFPLKQMYDLFPAGPAKGACKIAGLAKPTGCV
jgi:tRNA 2-thiouridine synthesizing protein E